MLLLATHGGSREVPLLAQAEAGGGDSQAAGEEAEGSQSQSDGTGPSSQQTDESKTTKSLSEPDHLRPESKSKSGCPRVRRSRKVTKEGT